MRHSAGSDDPRKHHEAREREDQPTILPMPLRHPFHRSCKTSLQNTRESNNCDSPCDLVHAVSKGSGLSSQRRALSNVEHELAGMHYPRAARQGKNYSGMGYALLTWTVLS